MMREPGRRSVGAGAVGELAANMSRRTELRQRVNRPTTIAVRGPKNLTLRIGWGKRIHEDLADGRSRPSRDRWPHSGKSNRAALPSPVADRKKTIVARASSGAMAIGANIS